MRRDLAALAAGILFGLGLAVSQMVSPTKVLGFLDIAGAWDPSLALVMVGAVLVSFAGYRLALGRGRPLFAETFQVPTAHRLDGRLIGGAALFGIGWGMVGFCPGPSISALAVPEPKIVGFVLAMLVGMAANRLIAALGPAGRPRAA